MSRSVNFDLLAGPYRFFEFLAFGRDLERTRFCLLDQLADRRSILVMGEGDGRCVERLSRLAPQAHIHCVDFSAAMLRKAEARIDDRDRARITFEQADALTWKFPERQFDAVVTLFFLDCFEQAQAAQIVPRLAGTLKPGARWLFADFVLPAHGLARLRARAWLRVLYGFFRLGTGLRTRHLPASERLIEAQGFRMEATRTFQFGLLRSTLFSQPGSVTCSS